MATAVQRRGAEYDAVVTWGEKLSLALLMQQSFASPSKPHIAMMYQFEKPNIRLPISLFRRNLHAVITWSTVQRRALIERIGYPAERVYLVRHYVDQVFYSPREARDEMICAVGAEMRDYVTLKAALAGTEIRCHIAADHVRVPGRLRLLNDRRVSINDISGPAGANVNEGRLTLPELRQLYARSRFVVVPLLHSDTDNGVTCILEAMAMGKPVICSRTRGQVDVIEDGVTGLYVPVGDPGALRAAMLELWNDPARALRMGQAARSHVEKYHTLEMFTAHVRSAAEAALAGRPAPDTWYGA
jgi:glycosyltransferase involved in cell wall biosynthesis